MINLCTKFEIFLFTHILPEDGGMYLLVLAHPGCPGQSTESNKMVVVVVVVVLTTKIQNNNIHLMAFLSGTSQVSQYQKPKISLDLLEQEAVSGNGISWAICKSALRPRQTMPVSHHSVFYRPDALPVDFNPPTCI